MSASSHHLDKPVLSRSQRRERTARALASAQSTRSDSRREALLEDAVRLNMTVARDVANRYRNRGIDTDDLHQVAYAALTRAARDFDPARHKDFLSYAVPTIRGEVKKYFRDLGWTVRPPRRIQEIQAQITRAEGELLQLNGRSPRPSEIAGHLGADVDDVVEAMSAEGCFAPASLDRPQFRGEDSGTATVLDLMGDEDPSWSVTEARLTLAPVLRTLKERDRRIIYLRFFEDRTQQEIADEIGVTQMQVSRLLERIMRDLHTRLTADDGAPLAS